MKLKYKEIRDWRIRQIGIQDYTCALCNDAVDPEEAVLDHCHKTGFIRKVLHRGCNSLLGKIENSMPRSRVDLRRLENIAGNLIEYIRTQHTEVLHPTFKIKEPKMPKGMGRGKGKKPPKR